MSGCVSEVVNTTDDRPRTCLGGGITYNSVLVSCTFSLWFIYLHSHLPLVLLVITDFMSLNEQLACLIRMDLKEIGINARN